MNKSISITALMVCLLVMATVIAADRPVSQLWVISGMSGPVSISVQGKDNASPQAKTGDQLRTPFSVKTGSTGSLIMTHGEDRVSIGPNATLMFPVSAKPAADNAVRIDQNAGSVLYKVEHRKQRTFSVETPYLVSVVKGTVFTIATSKEESTVALMEGSLQVMTTDRRQELLLEPGQVAVKVRNGQRILLLDQQKLSTYEKGPVLLEERNGRSKKTVDIRDSESVTELATVSTKNNTDSDLDSLSDEGRGILSTGEDVLDRGSRSLTDGVNIVGGDSSGDLTGRVSDLGTAAGDLTGAVIDSSGDLTGSVSDLGTAAGDLTGTVIDTSGDLTGTVIDTTGDLTGTVVDTTSGDTSVVNTITQGILK